MRRFLHLAGCLAALLLPAACGSDDSDAADAGIGDAGSPGANADATVVADAASLAHDASADASSDAAVPDAGPTGGPCDAGQPVEMGTDVRAECDAFEVCQNGVFVTIDPADSGAVCPTPLAADTAGCPASAAAALDAGACTQGVDCNYGDDFCTCTTLTDGGAVFVCPRPAAGCPAARPRLGTACTADGGSLASCWYLDCYSSSDPLRGVEQCVDGTWQPASAGADYCGR